MKQTENQIVSTIEMMKSWGILKDLTENEHQSLLCELKNIAGCAIMDSNNKIQNIMPDLYKSFMQKEIF